MLPYVEEVHDLARFSKGMNCYTLVFHFFRITHSVLDFPRLHAPTQGGASNNQFAPHLDSIKLNRIPVRKISISLSDRKLRECLENVQLLHKYYIDVQVLTL